MTVDELWQTRLPPAWELAALSLRYPGAGLAGAAAGGEWDRRRGDPWPRWACPRRSPRRRAARPSRRPAAGTAEPRWRRRAPARPATRGHAPVRQGAEPACSPYEGVLGHRRSRRGAAAFVREPPLHGGQALHARPAASSRPEGHQRAPRPRRHRNASSSSTWPCARPAPSEGARTAWPPRRSPPATTGGSSQARPSLDASLRRAPGRRGAPSLLPLRRRPTLGALLSDWPSEGSKCAPRLRRA